MIEQYHELSKRNDFKLNVTPFSSPRMHLGSFTEVCLIKSLLIFLKRKFSLFDRIFSKYYMINHLKILIQL